MRIDRQQARKIRLSDLNVRDEFQLTQFGVVQQFFVVVDFFQVDYIVLLQFDVEKRRLLTVADLDRSFFPRKNVLNVAMRIDLRIRRKQNHS